MSSFREPEHCAGVERGEGTLRIACPSCLACGGLNFV
jgi:hypothetical protein